MIQIKYNSKVGLIYISDYYYCASPNYWTLPGYDQNAYDTGVWNDYSLSNEDNWLYMGLEEWTITKVLNDGLLDLYYEGGINFPSMSNDYYGKSKSYAVRPVFYLESSVTYVSGDGTKNSPIVIE